MWLNLKLLLDNPWTSWFSGVAAIHYDIDASILIPKKKRRILNRVKDFK